MHFLFTLFCFLSITATIAQSTVKASSFGYSSSNSTNALVKALKSSHKKIVVDYQSGGWNIGPIKIFDVKDKEIIFEKGVELKAIKGKFNARTAALINFVRAKNLKLSGYGAKFKMNRSELQNYDSRTEYRHNIQITGGDGITIEGLTIEESGGDGVYVTGSNASKYAKNVILRDLKVINHSRDGISVISADGLTVENCTFSGTKGTILGCGINVEPNKSDERLKNIKFRNCTIKENDFYGIQISLYHMTSSSALIDVEFENCNVSNNYRGNKKGSPSEIRLGVGSSFNNAVRGQLTFKKVTVENGSHFAVSSRKPSTAFKAKFVDCTFKNVASSSSAVYLETPSYSIKSPPLGGFEFKNVKISSTSSDPFLRIHGWKTMDGLKDVTGDFIVANSKLNKDNAIGYSRVNKFSNVDVDFKLVSSISSSGNSGSTGSTEGEGSDNTSGNDSSDSDDNSNDNNEAGDSEDASESNSDSCTNTISITNTVSSAISRHAASNLTASSKVTHGSGTVNFKAGNKIILKSGFQVRANGNEVFIASLEDCKGSSTTGKVASLQSKMGYYHNWNPEIETDNEVLINQAPILSPNPVTDITFLKFNLESDDYVNVNVYDLNNQLVQPVIFNEKLIAGPQEIEVDITSLKPGVYFVSIEDSLEKLFVKAVKR